MPRTKRTLQPEIVPSSAQPNLIAVIYRVAMTGRWVARLSIVDPTTPRVRYEFNLYDEYYHCCDWERRLELAGVPYTVEAASYERSA